MEDGWEMCLQFWCKNIILSPSSQKNRDRNINVEKKCKKRGKEHGSGKGDKHNVLVKIKNKMKSKLENSLNRQNHLNYANKT